MDAADSPVSPEDNSDTNVNRSALLDLANDKHSEKAKSDYRTLLNGLIDVARFMLKQGMSFLVDEERKCLGDKGNFEAFLEWFGKHVVPDVGRVISKNPQMHQTMIAPSVLKNIVNACAKETIKAIVEDLNGDYFGILVGKSEVARDEEEMTIVLRYVARKGIVMERFIGVIHINDKSAQSSKERIDSLLMSCSLSPSKIRAQCYNGDANMEKEINDLKTSILQDNLSAYCTYCFAQPLHLTLVSVAKRHRDVDDFFGMLTFMLNVIGVSFERHDFSQENQDENLEELLKFGKILTGRDFNQKYDELEKSDDAPLESHFETVRSFITIFPSIVNILEVIATDDVCSSERMWADGLLDDLQSFEFVYMLHLMFKVLSITKELDIVLQRKDQDIVNALKLVGTTKRQFEMMRDGEWENLMDDVSSFCVKHDILIPKMDDLYVIPRGLKRKVSTVTYSHHYRVEVFDVVIDSQLQELERSFDTVSNDLFLGMASLSPVNSFANYDKDKIMRLANYYPNEFGDDKLQELSCQLDNYIVYMRQCDNKFPNLKGLGDLSKMFVQKKLHLKWPLVYLLLKLTLILPVADASVERSFSRVKKIKNEMHKKVDEELFNDCLVCYIEIEVFESVPDAAIVNQFHSMENI